MKYALFALALIAAMPVVAQTAPATKAPPVEAAGSIEALDTKNGFRSYRFGTPFSQMPNFQKRKGFYIDPLERQAIGDVNLNSLKFLEYEGKFSAVIFGTIGNANCAKLLDILTAQYGPPQKETSEAKMWVGNVCSMVVFTKTSYGAYNTSTSYSMVHISSNALGEQKTGDDQTKAKQAANKDL